MVPNYNFLMDLKYYSVCIAVNCYSHTESSDLSFPCTHGINFNDLEKDEMLNEPPIQLLIEFGN